MDCAVCGQPGACKCLEVDEFHNPIGDWVHICCAPSAEVDREHTSLQRFRGTSTYRIHSKAKAAVRRMWGKPGFIRLNMARPLRRAQVTTSKL